MGAAVKVGTKWAEVSMICATKNVHGIEYSVASCAHKIRRGFQKLAVQHGVAWLDCHFVGTKKKTSKFIKTSAYIKHNSLAFFELPVVNTGLELNCQD